MCTLLINLKLIDKNQQTPNSDIIHTTLKEKTVKNLINEIREYNWSCDNKTTIIEFEESEKSIIATGQSTAGPESYLEIVNMAKTILNMLNNSVTPDDIAKNILTEYHKNGCGIIPYNDIHPIKAYCPEECYITIWADSISDKDTITVFRTGNVIIPFSLNDYLFSSSYRDEMTKFKKTMDKCKIPYIFGSIYKSQKDIKQYAESAKKICKQIPEIEEQINSTPIILDWNEQNENLILLLGLKERYRQSEMSLKATLAHIKHSLKNI